MAPLIHTAPATWRTTEPERQADTLGRTDGHGEPVAMTPMRPKWRILVPSAFVIAILLAVVSTASGPDVDAQLSTLVDRLYHVADAEFKLATVCRLLQEARTLEQRKDWEKAGSQYARARDLMLRPRDPADPLSRSSEIARLEQQTLRFIRDRLSSLP